jgi:putative transposase
VSVVKCLSDYSVKYYLQININDIECHFMNRPLRHEAADGWYHVINRGAARRHIFINDYFKFLFLELLEATVQKYKFNIYSFCIMGNHYHLLVNTPKPNLSVGMRFLNSQYAIIFNKERGKDGPIFKDRFKSICVLDERYLLNLTRYIHLNPVTGGLVESPDQYYWSSYLDYVLQKNRFRWLKTDLLTTKKSTYKTYIKKGNSQKILDFYSKNKLCPILK